MKIYIKKISYLFLSLTLLLGSCEIEDSLTITSPDAAFTLNTPDISSVFLNFALPNNPAFTISWNDELNSSADYTVEMSTDTDFTTPIELGATTNNNFSITVNALNDVINNAGVTNFRDVAIYLRVKTNSSLTNSILLFVTTYPVEAPSFSSITNGDAFVLTLDNNDLEVVNVTWNDPILDSTLAIEIDYVLEAAAPNTSFATPIEVGTVSNLNYISLTNSQLNTIAIQSGVPVDTAGDLEFRLTSSITDTASGIVLKRVSEIVTINVTTYLTVLDLSSGWGLVGDATPNQWNGPDLPLYKTDIDGVLVGYVTLTDGQMKFRENNSWNAPDKNYGDNGADGSLEEGGANIVVSAGSYKITMDLNNLNYTMENFSLGIVGDAYNNWGATPDFMLEYDPFSNVFRGVVTLLDGAMKFRMNNSWNAPDKNYGDDGANGTLEEGGANINVAAGIYIATVNLNTFEYSLEKIDSIWGLVGSAFNNWGATPDAKFTRDWSKPFNDVWILKDVTLLTGEYKIRANESWNFPDKNYGDNGADGTLEEGGANIASTAGTYTISIDFSDPDNIIYTVN
jgi:hypothetical protein